MNSKILLVGRAGEETNSLRKELKRKIHYSVDVATSSNQAINAVTNGKVDLLLFSTEILTKSKLAMTNDLRALGQDFPVLVLANSIMADTIADLQKTKSTVFLEKPFETKDFFGLTEKLIVREEVKQRVFRRFLTNQAGNFSKPPALDRQINVQIRNLSQGGAYFEYEGRPHVNVGDQIYLEIPLEHVKREYKMRARVVWATPIPTTAGRNGLGVEFIR